MSAFDLPPTVEAIIRDLRVRLSALERATVIPSAQISVVNWSAPSGGGVPNFTTTDYDVGGLADLANDRLKAPRAGFYLITAYANFAMNATGRRGVSQARSSDSLGWHDVRMAVEATSDTSITVTGPLKLAANETVQMSVAQTSGGALDVDATLALWWVNPGG